MGKYFGTDGFRGEAGKNLTAEHAFKIGKFLGVYYNKLHIDNKDGKTVRIVIGKDTRRSSYMFEYAVIAGLISTGADAYMLHVTTTPSVAYVARTDGFDCGVMISASHNPYYDNGIKLINRNGEKMDGATISLLEDYIDDKSEIFPDGARYSNRKEIGKTVDYVSGRNRYIAYLISLGLYSFKGIKVGLDCANGSSWYIAKAVFEALGANVYVINDKPDGFNINSDAGSTHIEGLQEFVVNNKLDIGFAYDGDADRCLAVDENGNVLTGDHILYICGNYMKEHGELLTSTVVTTVMSNIGLYKAFDVLGIKYTKTDVGDKYVYECMSKEGHSLGGEQSGHIIFSKYATTGDGILTSLKIMEALIASKQSASKLAERLHIYPQKLINIKVKDKKSALADEDVLALIDKAKCELGDDGRILVRPSGTEPLIRIMAEASTLVLCEKYTENIAKVFENKGYMVK